MSTHSDKNQFKFLKYGCLVSGGLLLCLLIAALALFIYAHQTPSLPESFPDYPNSTIFKFNTSLPDDTILGYANCGEAFKGRKYRMLATTDNANQVIEFYKKVAAKQQFIPAMDGYAVGALSNAQVRCFHSTINAVELPTNVVMVLNMQDFIQAKVVNEIFPNIPAATKTLIILLQGYTDRV